MPKIWEEGFYYVIDTFNHRGPISGPFNSFQEAEKDRKELNIEGDCLVVLIVNGRPIPSYTLDEGDSNV